jgi:hypothetical protein
MIRGRPDTAGSKFSLPKISNSSFPSFLSLSPTPAYLTHFGSAARALLPMITLPCPLPHFTFIRDFSLTPSIFSFSLSRMCFDLTLLYAFVILFFSYPFLLGRPFLLPHPVVELVHVHSFLYCLYHMALFI